MLAATTFASAKTTRHNHKAKASAEPPPAKKAGGGISPEQDAANRNTVNTISNAFSLWRNTMAAEGKNVPSCIDVRFAVMVAVLETTLEKRRNGFLSFTPDRASAFWEVRDDLVRYLNNENVRAHIPALQNSRTVVTKENLLNYFYDPVVQFAALGFNAMRNAEEIKSVQSLQRLDDEKKRALLYIGHHNPKLFYEFLERPNARNMASLTPDQQRFLDINKRIYGPNGTYSPIRVLYRIPAAAEPHLNLYTHGPAIVPAAQAQRPKQRPAAARARTRKHSRS